MNDSLLWLSASLACLLCLSLLSTAASLFLIRRANHPSRSEHLAEQRLIQLSLDLRRLEQRVRELERRRLSTESAGAPRDPGSTAREAAPSLISVPNMTLQADVDTDAANLDPKHEDVWTMAERGLDAAEIARTTGRPIGQVELIIRLHRHHHASKNAGEHAGTT